MYSIKVYSLKTEGNLSVSRNFKVREFACKDGSDVVLICPLTVWILQNVRDHFGKPVRITSAYRTPEHNAKSGGATSSLHMLGVAVDFVVDGVTADKVQAYLESCVPSTCGIGKATNYTHIDTRETKARWTY